ncbi:PREDICTED: raftlin-2 [Nanorana parkeri]|uniref:raftlin-2 n=1 Tax=Nanorana parkeri TaxID=125878 RepID=UPI000854A967|nr:PREDICTED: raftlin-2 [Nanorana parkeri]
MGCGLRKLEDSDDSSPGKIFSTLKRPQVETKTDLAYEYVLLDFSLEASLNINAIRIKSLLDIPSKVEEYYLRGYTVAAVHPVIVSSGRRRHLPISYLYRVVLYRLKLSQKHTAHTGQKRASLVIEEWMSMYEALTNEGVKILIEKVNEASRKGMRFVGFLTKHFHQTTNTLVDVKNSEQSRNGADDYKTLSGQSSESGIDEDIHPGSEHFQDFVFSDEGSLYKARKSQGKTLYAVFNALDDDLACYKYIEGNLSMKVCRKGPTVSSLEADWLEMTTFYYKQGFSLIDSFVHWETLRGDLSPKSLDGLFIYEDEAAQLTGSKNKGNDAIIVEQLTVFEGSEIKADYGPLLHTLAEFGWGLTCVIPTPIIKYNSEGNLTTKQIIFFQRSAMPHLHLAVQSPEKKSVRHTVNEERNNKSSRSIGQKTPGSFDIGQPSNELNLSPSKQYWRTDSDQNFGSFSGFSSNDSMLRDLDDVQYEQEEAVTQVTCM